MKISLQFFVSYTIVVAKIKFAGVFIGFHPVGYMVVPGKEIPFKITIIQKTCTISLHKGW
jgi:hypothetical protein